MSGRHSGEKLNTEVLLGIVKGEQKSLRRGLGLSWWLRGAENLQEDPGWYCREGGLSWWLWGAAHGRGRNT